MQKGTDCMKKDEDIKEQKGDKVFAQLDAKLDAKNIQEVKSDTISNENDAVKVPKKECNSSSEKTTTERDSSNKKEDTKEVLDSKFGEYIGIMCSGKLTEATEKEIVDFMICYYERGYRHSYYIISEKVYTAYRQAKDKNSLEFVDALNNNAKKIRDSVIVHSTKAKKGVEKLYDHIQLETTRLTEEVRRLSELDKKIEDYNQIKKDAEKVKEDAEKVKKEVEKMQDELQESQEDIDNMQKEYITILGIFASIVLAFTGGIAFSTSVLNNIASASIYRTIIVTLIIGLVLINTLFGLFYYVNKLVNEDKIIRPLVISNAVIIVLIGITVFAWSYGWVESRNARIGVNDTGTLSQEEKDITVTSGSVLETD